MFIFNISRTKKEMKFGKYVEDHAVPEWISQYIAYKELKKKIKAIAKVNLLPISRGITIIQPSLFLFTSALLIFPLSQIPFFFSLFLILLTLKNTKQFGHFWRLRMLK